MRKARSLPARPSLVNPNLATGEVELRVETLDVVSTSPPLPFQLDEEGVDETLRLRYRWLDLRREQCSETSVSRADGRRHPAVDGGARVHRHLDADADFEPLPRAHVTSSSRSACSPGRSSRCRSRRSSSSSCWSSPASTAITRSPLLPGRRPSRRPPVRVPAARRRDGVPRPGVRPRRHRAGGASACARRSTSSRRSGLSPAAVRGGDAPLRTDKPDLRFGLEIQDATEVTRGSEFKVFAGARRALTSSCRGRSRVPSSASSKRSRRSGARKGSRTSSWTRTARCGRRSRSSSQRPSSARSALRRLDRALRRGRRSGRSRACSARSGCDWGASSI